MKNNKKLCKLFAMCLTLVMAFSLIACSDTGNSGTATGGTQTGASAVEALPEDASPAMHVIADFTDKEKSGNYESVEALAAALLEDDALPFEGAYMQVEEGWLNGFTEEITGFTEAYMFGPAIGSIPFIGYVFVVDDGAEAFAKNLENLADLRWNICTQADEMLCHVEGTKVCFVMAPASFEE